MAAALLTPLFGLAAEFDLDVEELNEISPRPGTVIGSENFERYAHLFDRDFAKFVEGGFRSSRIPLSSSRPDSSAAKPGSPTIRVC